MPNVAGDSVDFLRVFFSPLFLSAVYCLFLIFVFLFFFLFLLLLILMICLNITTVNCCHIIVIIIVMIIVSIIRSLSCHILAIITNSILSLLLYPSISPHLHRIIFFSPSPNHRHNLHNHQRNNSASLFIVEQY